MGTRISQLNELLHFSRPIADVLSDLSTFGWDSDEELVALEAVHISTVLNRFLSGEISVNDVEDWANAIECREDVGIKGSSAADALDELANPLLTRSLTRQSAAEWVAVLGEAATIQAQSVCILRVPDASGNAPLLRSLSGSVEMHSETSQVPNLSGMTVNERLFTLGLLDEFDSLVRRGERDGMVTLLKRAELSESDAIACADRVLSDPKRYGY